MTAAEIAEIYSRLHDRTPSPETELDYVNVYTLLVAVVLCVVTAVEIAVSYTEAGDLYNASWPSINANGRYALKVR